MCTPVFIATLFTIAKTWKEPKCPATDDWLRKMWYVCMHAKLLQLCLILCHPMGHSPPGSSVHGILQEGILKWVAMPSSRGSSKPRDQTRVSYVSCIGRWVLQHQCHLGSPWYVHMCIYTMEYCHLQQHGWTQGALQGSKSDKDKYYVISFTHGI